ncbi:MAG: hypothetical protein FJZ01_01370 [Candidatus Sericytochromatia bacterium]|nr:hypothetical protein [Candidatus Tanganyikabacteria bacterium]
MPPVIGDRLVKESSRKYLNEVMAHMRRAFDTQGRRDAEHTVGKMFEDVLVRSESLEHALAKAQAEHGLSGQQLQTVRDGLRGIINDNRGRIADWEHNVRHRSSAGREDFLWKTWDWLSQSLTWLESKVG